MKKGVSVKKGDALFSAVTKRKELSLKFLSYLLEDKIFNKDAIFFRVRYGVKAGGFDSRNDYKRWLLDRGRHFRSAERNYFKHCLHPDKAFQRYVELFEQNPTRMPEIEVVQILKGAYALPGFYSTIFVNALLFGANAIGFSPKPNFMFSRAINKFDLPISDDAVQAELDEDGIGVEHFIDGDLVSFLDDKFEYPGAIEVGLVSRDEFVASLPTVWPIIEEAQKIANKWQAPRNKEKVGRYCRNRIYRAVLTRNPKADFDEVKPILCECRVIGKNLSAEFSHFKDDYLRINKYSNK